VKLDAFFNLLANAFLGTAVGRIESVVATERAAAGTDFAVTIRTAESSVDADFLHATAEDTSEI
jgi:hypothetical protein